MRVDVVADYTVDPALGYTVQNFQLEYATCATLVNYPDGPPPAGSSLQPEIASEMPTVSPDGLTYTFHIRNDYAFSPPATGVVTAESMKYTFERAASPALAGPGAYWLTNIVGATEFENGQAPHISGIVAQGDTLTFQLIQPQGWFPTYLAMPLFCAVPTSLPFSEVQAPVPSAGPYYIATHTPNQSLVALRNPNYSGPRPVHFDSIEYTIGHTPQEIRQRIESGVSDYGFDLPPDQQDELAQLYGPGSAPAALGLQQWFANADGCTMYIPLNTERPLFADPNMRKAVNYAIDRTALAAVRGTGAVVSDQFLPPGMPGFTDAQIYPDHPDLATARQLAGWQPGDPMRDAVLYYNSSGTLGPPTAQLVHDQLLQIGIQATMVGWPGGDIYTRMGHRGEPFDLGAGSVGWCEDWHDPWNFMQLMDGTTIHDGDNNLNFSYFNDPVFNDRMHTANQLVGAPRFAEFGQIDVDITRQAAPVAAWANLTDRDFFSQRIGCQSYGTTHWTDLAALCLRPEISVEDVSVTRPPSGTATATFNVRLASDTAGPVTVDYGTRDGSAHAGTDYAPVSGTVTFAAHERARTVDVTVDAGSPGDPDKTFFLDLGNQSTGTIVRAAGTATLAAPPPPPPPPPPPKCVVPKVIGQKLARAKRRIVRAHCRVGKIVRKRSKLAKKGRVLAQKPKASRRKLKKGTKVKLTVGKGPRRR